MAEKRRPDTVLWIRHGGARKSHKVEIFSARKFEHTERFTDKSGHPIPPNNIDHYHRLRVNGIWFPAGRRILYTKNQCVMLVKKDIFKP